MQPCSSGVSLILMDSLHLAGKLLGIDISGPQLDDETRKHLEQHAFGGVCLFRKNIQNRSQVAQLVGEIRAILGPQAWISIDQEGGAVLRTSDLPQAPSAMALGAVSVPTLAEAVGGAVGRGLIGLGINWNYAPCLDVNTDPRNPVIAERSFGSDPERVAELGLAWAKGLQSAGVIATAKHFPGHGDTYLDSHLALPRVDKPREVLEGLELYPFRKAVEAGIPAIMTAHIIYSQLDPENPATLSRAILSGLLRQEWGYDGVIVTDSMLMKAIAAHYPAGQAAVRSLQAGADVVLALGSWETKLQQVQAVARAIERREISGARVEESVQRLELLEQHFPGRPRPYSTEPADLALMDEAARRSITAYAGPRLPQPTDKVLLVAPRSTVGENVYESLPTTEHLARHLASAFDLEVLAYAPENPQSYLPEVNAKALQADFLLFATTTRGFLSEGEIRLGQAIFKLGKPAVHLALWNPYQVMTLGQPALISYGFREPALRALVGVLQGQPAPGNLPI